MSPESGTAGQIRIPIPPADMVRDGVWSIPLPMPDPGNPYTLSYVVEGSDGSLCVIDPGTDGDENWRLLREGLTSFGLAVGDIRSIFITHLHPDHYGLAGRLKDATGAPVTMLRQEQESTARLAASPDKIEEKLDDWGVPESRKAEIRSMSTVWGEQRPLIADRLLEDGDRLDVRGRSLEVLWTPGHTIGHACLVDSDAGIVYTGDHVLPTINPGIGLGGTNTINPIAQYFASLDRIDAFDGFEVAPGHGHRFRGLAARTAEIREQTQRRADEVAGILDQIRLPSVFEVAAHVSWKAGWERMTGFYLFSALSQTSHYMEFVAGGRTP